MQYQPYNQGDPSPYGQPPGGMVELEIASAWQRLGAWIVDLLILVGVAILAGIVGEILDPAEISEGALAGAFGAIAAFGCLAVGLFLVATRGQTPGKIALNIKIVRTDGTDAGWSGMLLREIVGKYIPSFIPIVNFIWLLSYVWIIFDANRQGWHDKIASTYVVKVQPTSGYSYPTSM